MTVKDKTLFVSGGSRGVGLEIAQRAARDGPNVALIAKTAEPNPRLAGPVYSAAEQIDAAGGHAPPIVGDIRDMRRYDLMQDINTRGTFVVSRACLPHLRRAENPHILTLSPPISLEPRWLGPHIAYTIAKYGMTLCALGFAAEAAGGRDRVQRAVAADADRDRAVQNPLGGDEAMAASRKPAAVRGRSLRGHHPPQPRMHRQYVPVRGRPRRGGRHRFRGLRVRPGRDAAGRPVRRPRLKRCGRVVQSGDVPVRAAIADPSSLVCP
jgi:NAD(P)-dependent dehydrogenase (short-subunit alcohol dehydrogenase family)